MTSVVSLQNGSGVNLNKPLCQKIIVAAGIVCLSSSAALAEKHKMSAECYLIEAAAEKKENVNKAKSDSKDILSFSEVLFSSYQKSYSADYQNLDNKWVLLKKFLDRFSIVMFTGVTWCT
ncbi:MAG: hypothetical protein DKT66_24575 [Candidatus Melainabacteria bacterium]|nr:MAG: hypothetical protein DKT66_24575 [Candidatus Melainabacteria bacterium]